MRKIREVLRLHSELGCTHRQIAAACSVSPATVCDYLSRALRAGLGWQQAQSLSEAEVEAKLFVHIGRSEPDVRSAVDFPWVHRELRRTGVTLQLLWSDYRLAAQQAGPTNTFNSATCTPLGAVSSGSACARPIGQARRCSWITRARGHP